jgi:hypothetical protein
MLTRSKQEKQPQKNARLMPVFGLVVLPELFMWQRVEVLFSG